MDIIPAFPLSIVVFPGEKVKLYIFESRYKQLISEAHERETTFALVPYYEDKKVTFGTEMKIVNIIKKYDDGKMDIEVKGIRPLEVVNLHTRYPNRLYPGAEIIRMPWTDDLDGISDPSLLNRIKSLYEIMNIDGPKIADLALFRSYQIAHKVGFNLEQELEFLTISTEVGRQEFMKAHLEKLLPIAQEMESIRKRVAMNGHIKNLESLF